MRQRGFTLLEMLISFALVSLLFLALFASFNTISRGWDAADTRINKTEDMRLIADFLRRQLSQAMVVKITGKKEAKVYAFEGTATSLRYAAPLQPLQHQGGVFLIELNIVSSKAGKKLEMLFAPYRPELTWDEAFKDAEPVLVFDGLKDADFEYFGAEEEGKDADWTSDWEDKPRYPNMLKLRLEDQERAWPEMLVDLPQVTDYAK
ncbi:prepilin-type N-terminal cleavage/methylation domain-containing protein [Thiothrix litoralis]|jgi:prepilin-type N-terminal cleavage/methylation domain-containing protein|uniref:Prepilin-type N-terminal cleavage/methylation domain-containing protein n=2 Tax=Thiothrix litoralis TaxID=2891210 RepID=A0ABX7WMW7_9GAMM|nr:prepilin-type N-terminal cleavage/methylation domain-containing protein [Thiothrix litoralis]QTR44884.1 prepilin-type N-terminal cleavage/methylation domain-containing protein [Thiothrix litoralis]